MLLIIFSIPLNYLFAVFIFAQNFDLHNRKNTGFFLPPIFLSVILRMYQTILDVISGTQNKFNTFSEGQTNKKYTKNLWIRIADDNTSDRYFIFWTSHQP
jgi:hypothetical protein